MNENTKEKTKPAKEYHSIKADKALYNDLKRLADSENRTIIGQIRQIYEAYLKIKK